MKGQRADEERLQDVLDAIAAIKRYPVGTRSDFDGNELLRYFVLKHIEIIGEAVYKLSDELKAGQPDVPWARIAATRHKLVHDYWQVDWELVWQLLVTHLSPLREQIESIQRSHSKS
jgi:uncharacterized protein with HEPN domain